MFRLRIMAIGLVGVLLAACSQAGGSPSASSSSGASATRAPVTIRIQLAAGFTGVLPLYVAGDAGFFAKYGITPDYINSNEATKLVLSGDADVGTPSPVVAAVAVSKGQKLQIVCSVQNKLTQSVLVRKDVADSLSLTAGMDWKAALNALKGKKIGVTVRGGSPDLNLRYMLVEAGLNPDQDVNIVAAGSGGNEVAAIKAKQVDAILTFTPITQTLTASGEGVDVINLAKGQGPEALQQPFVVAAVTADYLQKNADAAHRFVKAMVETMAWIKDPANAAKLKDIVVKRLNGIDPAIADQVVTEMTSTMDPSFPTASLDNVNKVLEANKLVSSPITADQIIASDFVPTP